MIIGDLRYDIIVKELTTSRDSNNGSVVETWTTKYSLKAKVNTKGGNKGVHNDEIFNAYTITFTCHYRDVVDTDRIEYNGNMYKILMIGEIGYREGLEIIAEKINE
jgi:SPP1 family predicted phage head-tail adaptor